MNVGKTKYHKIGFKFGDMYMNRGLIETGIDESGKVIYRMLKFHDIVFNDSGWEYFIDDGFFHIGPEITEEELFLELL